MSRLLRLKGLTRSGVRWRQANSELARIPNAAHFVATTTSRTTSHISIIERSWLIRAPFSQASRSLSSSSSSPEANNAEQEEDVVSHEPLSLDDATGETEADDATTENMNATMDRTMIRKARFDILRNCKNPNKESVHQAQKKLNELAAESILVGKKLANIAIYNNCLDAWGKSKLKTGFRKASELLETMHQRHEEYPDCFPSPNTISYHCALHACAQTKHTEAAKKADELIKKMEELSASNPDGDIHPETRSYDMVILAHAHQAPLKYGAANDAEDWLRYLSKLNTEGGPGPGTLSFNHVLKAWKDSPEDKGADRALELLHLMIKLNREGHHEQVTPSEKSFATVINAFASRNRAEEAEDVLKMALSFFLDADFVRNELVDLRWCFNIAINGWAKSTDSDAPERADSLLRDMRAFSQETQLVIAEPNIYSHTSCMEAMANSGRPDATEIVEARLYGLLEANRENFSDGSNSQAAFDCAIRAWFRSDKDNKAERMEALLNTLLDLAQQRNDPQLLPRPNTVNLCLNAWCRAGEGKSKAINLLNRMEIIGCIDSESYIPLIGSLLEESQKSNDSDSAYAAAVVLERLQAQIAYRGKIRWPSDPERLYNKVFTALRNTGSGNAADRAYVLLEGMEKATEKRAKPSCLSYTVVIAALAKEPSPERTKKALEIFDHLIRLHHDENSKVKADQYAFHAILTCLANTSERWAADRARRLMGTMLNMYVVSGNKKLMPNSMCYDRCLQARARCGDLASVRDAVEMLKKFVDDFRQARSPDLPSEGGINAVLKYCSILKGSQGKKLAEEVLVIKEDLKREGHLITYKNA